MPELQLTLLMGFIRIIIGSFLISKSWKKINKHLLTTLFISFIYSSAICILFLTFMRHIILAIGAIMMNDDYTELIVFIYLTIYILSIFGIELKNNHICLEGIHEKKSITRSTIITHVISLLVIILFAVL